MRGSSVSVPAGPYFHGTRSQIAIGAKLVPGTVDPMADDSRLMVWAFVDVGDALRWAATRPASEGPTLYVYEVELDDPSVDPNVHRPGSTGPITSVMAPGGRAVCLICSLSVEAT
jgi:hypothetical protein